MMMKRLMAGLALSVAGATGALALEPVSQADFDQAVGCFANQIGVYELMNMRLEDLAATAPSNPVTERVLAETTALIAEEIATEIDAIAITLDQLTHPAYGLDVDRAMSSYEETGKTYQKLLSGTPEQRADYVNSPDFSTELSDACYDLLMAITAIADANIASGAASFVE